MEMIYNLCDNAVKYNREGGRVLISLGQDGRKVRLSVKDTGIGIPEEEQTRIFERFYRVDKSHSKEVGGTGLGLAIVKHAAALHEGRSNCTAGLEKVRKSSSPCPGRRQNDSGSVV